MRQIIIFENEDLQTLKAGRSLFLNVDGGKTIEIAMAGKRAKPQDAPTPSKERAAGVGMSMNDKVLEVLKRGPFLWRDVGHLFPGILPLNVRSSISRLQDKGLVKTEMSQEIGTNRKRLLRYVLAKGGNK